MASSNSVIKYLDLIQTQNQIDGLQQIKIYKTKFLLKRSRF